MQLTYVEGASPDKWLRVWRERHPRNPMRAVRVPESEQLRALEEGSADLAIVRVVDQAALARLQATQFAVELYRERTVAVLSRDHELAEFEALDLADFDDVPRTPNQATVEDTLAVTAAGVGVCIVPMS
ncbi:MAG TPA: LysR substrate-binding domain-containing protein, partial [Microbacteriaceae bacterium]|nr:LysR substrate-binding domain-containing protein [Microbacteriaceae bacterium]